MIGTLTTFSLLNRDMKTSLERVAKQTPVKRELDYYTKTIGSIKTVDAFMKDTRIYNFALKSLGLEDMAYAKAFIRKVLDSDLSDSGSFANRLSDRRYRDLAETFGFRASKADVQTKAQEDDLIGLYKQSHANEQTAVAKESSYYKAQIDTVTNVDAFLSNERLRDYALRAFGIDGTYISRNYLRSVLTSDPGDPQSFANKTERAAFIRLAAAFNFDANGGVGTDYAQNQAQRDDVLDAYNISVPSFVTKEAADYNRRYYEATIGAVRSVSDISGDKRLISYLTTAYGLNSNLSAFELRLILSSDLAMPNNYAKIVGAESMVRAFNFGGRERLADDVPAQDVGNISDTSDRYLARYDTIRRETLVDAASNFSRRMQTVANLKDFLLSNKDDKDRKNDKLPELYQVALRAFGIGVDEVSVSKLKKLLTSDPYDLTSEVSKTGDSRLVALTKAFNFGSDGKASAPVTAVSDVQIARWISDFRARTTTSLKGAELEKAKREIKKNAEYFATAMKNIKSLDNFTGDKRLVAFVAKAAGIDPRTMSEDTLKKAFASDQVNEKSYLNQQANSRLRDIVTAFNFDKAGKITRRNTSAGSETRKIEDLYLHQSLEKQQGDSNDGVRLALYFQRKAASITSIYSILGDRALFEVVTTTFNLPYQISAMDVDRQAAMLTRFIKIEDLQNQEKLKSFLKRFASMYDMKNAIGQNSGIDLLANR